MMTSTRFLIALALPLALGATATRAADVNAGAEKAKQICAACHGIDGNSQVPDFPRLAGQHPDYLAKALRDYQTGARKNPIMIGMSKPLSKADIENVSAYYAQQPARLSARE